MQCGRNFDADTKQAVAIAMINPDNFVIIMSFFNTEMLSTLKNTIDGFILLHI